MTQTAVVLALLASMVTHIVLDAVWLGYLARDTYKRQLGALMAPRRRWGVAAAFYVIYAVGLVWFAVMPAAAAGAPVKALALGGLLGLVAYGTYDLTNLATLRDWPVAITLVDLAWGTVASAISAFAAAMVVMVA
jgi:uncharacterized membrane protein